MGAKASDSWLNRTEDLGYLFGRKTSNAENNKPLNTLGRGTLSLMVFKNKSDMLGKKRNWSLPQGWRTDSTASRDLCSSDFRDVSR